eukprot:CAMPEP_0198657516 /NCGR_PEP_ID=MMETSP1467-20131203/16772_1 /TAXON_ID=1462469 /ORGANISM="unid. sp., Strain CCMP2135" /LENGTH=219 /DNA_ID=CAMNT_0044393703 /DNA_START=9 /DNA_END=665 /DNA_ORIENTATION=+
MTHIPGAHDDMASVPSPEDGLVGTEPYLIDDDAPDSQHVGPFSMATALPPQRSVRGPGQQSRIGAVLSAGAPPPTPTDDDTVEYIFAELPSSQALGSDADDTDENRPYAQSLFPPVPTPVVLPPQTQFFARGLDDGFDGSTAGSDSTADYDSLGLAAAPAQAPARGSVFLCLLLLLSCVSFCCCLRVPSVLLQPPGAPRFWPRCSATAGGVLYAVAAGG